MTSYFLLRWMTFAFDPGHAACRYNCLVTAALIDGACCREWDPRAVMMSWGLPWAPFIISMALSHCSPGTDRWHLPAVPPAAS